MNKEDINKFILSLGGKPNHGTNKWTGTTCLMATWLHDGGLDKSPSAGITNSGDDLSIYNCFSCGYKKPLYDLVVDFRKKCNSKKPDFKYDLKTANKLALNEIYRDKNPLDDLNELKVDYEENKKSKNNPIEYYPFSEDWLNSFVSAKGHKYAKYRSLTDKLIDDFEVKIDSTQNRICFPIRDFDGVLMGLHGRSFDDQAKLRYFSYDFKEKRNPSIWIGENLVDLNNPIILTEGMFDQTQIYKYYPNVLASRSSSISDSMIDRIKDCSFVITAYDLGTGGDVARKRISKYFNHKNVTHVLPDKLYKDFGATPDFNIINKFSFIYS